MSQPSTQQHFYIDLMEALFIVGMSLISFKHLHGLSYFLLIFTLAFILTFHCVPLIVCRVVFFFFNIFHQNVIFFSSNKIVPDLGLALTHSVPEILSFRKQNEVMSL